MIVIFGMAHSGTTVTTHILNQFENIHLHTSGSESFLLECDEVAFHLPVNKWQPKKLQELQNTLPNGHHLMIKRPWTESRFEFWRQHFPNAYYICLLRDYKDIVKSWTSATSKCPRLKGKKEGDLWQEYNLYLRYAVNFPNYINNCKYLLANHGRMLLYPQLVFDEISLYLNINYKFNVQQIGRGNIKKKIQNSLDQ